MNKHSLCDVIRYMLENGSAEDGEKNATVLSHPTHLLTCAQSSPSPFLSVRMVALGSHRADLIINSNRKSCCCHLLKLKFERW